MIRTHVAERALASACREPSPLVSLVSPYRNRKDKKLTRQVALALDRHVIVFTITADKTTPEPIGVGTGVKTIRLVARLL